MSMFNELALIGSDGFSALTMGGDWMNLSLAFVPDHVGVKGAHFR